MTKNEPLDMQDVLRNFRATYLLSQAQAASLLRMPLRTYQGYEAGRNFIYPHILALAIGRLKDLEGETWFSPRREPE